MMAFCCPSSPASRSSAEQLHGTHLRRDAPALAARPSDELQASARRPRFNGARSGRGRDALPIDGVRRDAGAEQDIGERRRLRGRVPAVHVERRIGLGDAPRLHLRQRRRERLSLFHGSEDEVGRAVHHAAKAGDGDGRERLPHQVEHRDSVHHRALEEEPAIGAPGRTCQLSVRKRDRPFIRGDDVRAARECGDDVARRRLAARDVKRRRLDDDEPPLARRRAAFRQRGFEEVEGASLIVRSVRL